MARLDWLLIAKLASGGLVMGLGAVYGILVPGVQFFVWLVFAALWVAAVAAKAPSRSFSTGFLVAAFAALLSAAVQAVMLDTYLSNNPTVAQTLAQEEFQGGPRVFILIGGLGLAALLGLAVGAMAAVVTRLVRKPRPEA